jgi:phosphomannomutase
MQALVAPTPLPEVTDVASVCPALCRFLRHRCAGGADHRRLSAFGGGARHSGRCGRRAGRQGGAHWPRHQFIPVDTEAIRPEDVELARVWAREFGFDAIISTDGDSDRPLLADHTGEWLRGDVLGVLCARALKAQAVITPVSSNTVLERSQAFPVTDRTRIGSPFVIAAMNAQLAGGLAPVVGYEANGGFCWAARLARWRLCPRAMRCCRFWR